MNSLKNQKFQAMSSQGMLEITGGKKVLNYIECIRNCETGDVSTLRHYNKYTLDGAYVGTTTGRDKKGDVGGCYIK